jgi:long-chain acyl-CoA synthetase
MIISGGERLFDRSRERDRPHPDVAECAVIGIPDQRWGEAVHAIVVRGPAPTSPPRISGIAGPRSPATNVPRVDLRSEPLPQSSVNKIDKAALRAPFWSGRTRQVN